MKTFASGCLAILSLSLLLSACQSAQQLSADELAGAFSQFEQSLASDQLSVAESQLVDLQQRAAGDARLDVYQRQLADAYLRRGQQALQAGDLDGATKALSHARSLLPRAPALTTGLDGAIAQTREPEPSPPPATGKQALLIDPNAPSSLIPLPMLDTQDNQRLYPLLDAIAVDTVNFRCALRLELRDAKDFPWFLALLKARIERLDPNFNPVIEQAIEPNQVPQLLLSPQR